MNTLPDFFDFLVMERNKIKSLPDGFEIHEGYFPERMEEIGRFRIRAWRNENGINPTFFSQEVWIDSLDKNAHHWIITKEKVIVAAARLSFHECIEEVPYADFLHDEHRPLFQKSPIASINRLVVDPAFRGRGFARILDNERIKLAAKAGSKIMIAFPQLSRLVHLQKLGFNLISQLENIPEMPERPFFLMKLDL
ncbi:GNAT family N-acetyltransferase [Runella sp. CRIBMP]|nr:GNAT family N-acetyltransferase [Runella sp. CRIBMP]